MLFSAQKLKIRCGSFFITHHIFVLKVYIKKPQKQKNIASIRDSKGPCQPRQRRVSTGRQKIYRFHKAWDVLYGTVANSRDPISQKDGEMGTQIVSAADFDTII